MMRRGIPFAALILLVSVPSLAFAAQPRVGSTSGQFLKIGIGARAVGMGEAFLAVADDASALYYNPAGIVHIEGRELLASHVALPADVNYEYAGLVWRLGENLLGLSFGALYTDAMKVTTPAHPDGTGDKFVYSCFQGGLTYARSLTDRFSFGATLKHIRMYPMDTEYTMTAWCGDIGSLYYIGHRNLRFGVRIANFGSDLEAIEESYALPVCISLGVASEPYEEGPHRVTLSALATKPADNVEFYNLGTEYWYNGLFALRGGYAFEHDALSWSLGAGFKLGVGGSAFNVDYSYSGIDWLDDIQRISIGAGF
jgi:hypothetical protein